MRRVVFSLFFLIYSQIASQENPALLKNSTNGKSQVKESDESGIVLFNPPTGWSVAESTELPPTVKLMVIGKGPSVFPPSMNFSTQPYDGTLKQYLKVIKSINDSLGYQWKDLGTIKTEAGSASLSQVDTKSEWGEIRQMHVVLLKNKQIYILTGAALRDDFSRFYKVFFEAFRSLRVDKNIFEMIKKPQQRSQLKDAINELNAHWNLLVEAERQLNPELSTAEINSRVFEKSEFQSQDWQPFEELLNTQFKEMGKNWQDFVLNKVQNDLFIGD